MTTDLPTARAILLLRHPVDRAYSHYWYQRSLGFEKRSFEQAVRDELRAPDDQPFRHLGDGRYGPILHRLDQHVPDDRRLVLLFDDLRADAEGTFGSVCRFIGVDHDRAPEEVGAVVNATTMLHSEWLREQMLRWHAWRRLPFGIADRIDRLNRLETRYPPMPAALRRELVAWFADDVAETAAHLGRDLSAWTS
jgi:hypothetical protein